ncbi:hypothetical protein [Luteolibacter soli]|uniref:Uncharacterized protein n=1 Tax=Luteolibacter soli TaxID=3135280 RepID=A0ABU9AY28_9BACT
MKTLLLSLLTALATSSLAQTAATFPTPLPCEKEGKVIPQFITRENYTFTNSTLLAKYADGLLFQVDKAAPPVNQPYGGMENCLLMIPEHCLPDNLRTAVGGFTTAAAKAATEQRVAALQTLSREEQFPKRDSGHWNATWYDADQDPFHAKPGRTQTWEESQALLAKLKAENGDDKNPKPDGPGKPIKPAKPDKVVIIEDLAGTKWDWGSGGELELRKDGTARHSRWKNPGTWEKQADGTIKLTDAKGGLFTITLSNNGTGKVIASGGAQTTITLTRGGKKQEDPKPTGKPK